MSSRFPFSEAPVSGTKELIEQALFAIHGSPPPFQWMEVDGKSMLGSHDARDLRSYTPTFVNQFFTLAKTVYDNSVVKPRNRELAILGLTSVLDVPFVVYSHREVAAKVGLTGQQYEEGRRGKVPSGLSEEEAVAYRLGQILPALKGPLDDATWQEASSKMNKAEIVGVLHTVAGYRWVAMLEQVNGLIGMLGYNVDIPAVRTNHAVAA
ncbi:hypothetical protein L249_1670 [Ophiocordyceps polyrhachis-furcata BCC 54312]|uniref:Carboxymuconolactone decarboxylase-like domain-containing protein n=1 Tax=Ophiocordyceps polyrhachis-furcata BCC 54312 TaxID=1330021 RepID=A0A367KZN0_9HYPO|nr:hypothetical protein L249_1670 [Ophiocordyceps polyrhachis-furcata BCC 54312]